MNIFPVGREIRNLKKKVNFATHFFSVNYLHARFSFMIFFYFLTLLFQNIFSGIFNNVGSRSGPIDALFDLGTNCLQRLSVVDQDFS